MAPRDIPPLSFGSKVCNEAKWSTGRGKKGEKPLSDLEWRGCGHPGGNQGNFCSVTLVRALLRKTHQPRGYWVVGHKERKLRVEGGERSRKDVAELPQLPQDRKWSKASPRRCKAAWRQGDADRGSCLGWLEVHTAQTRPGNMHF